MCYFLPSSAFNLSPSLYWYVKASYVAEGAYFLSNFPCCRARNSSCVVCNSNSCGSKYILEGRWVWCFQFRKNLYCIHNEHHSPNVWKPTSLLCSVCVDGGRGRWVSPELMWPEHEGSLLLLNPHCNSLASSWLSSSSLLSVINILTSSGFFTYQQV